MEPTPPAAGEPAAAPRGRAPGVIVLAHLDGAEGRSALEQTIGEAHRRGARVVVVSYRTDAPASPAYASPATLDALRARLAGAGVPHEIVRAETDPADQLLTLAESTGAELLVLALRRRSPVMKFFIGSIAQRVILEAPCPVLAVK
ncbi:universal stress protein [Marinitenerispora sediminis]|uniref:Universal stress protein n=1 Tax=Marinitenerispora sediminis TaxID=1931232 RepID=A0A368TBZ9_9ACTN|nr:universal stress protein [Marinitenerispora sediminis]RCV48477.1 universal stress protein [Marinitenerispora sediminis]RCV50047.1 universal stress protein [Marinitenerispora sediminis]RCV62470.1 universal stress protein [Marinitenerispora sediminis]